MTLRRDDYFAAHKALLRICTGCFITGNVSLCRDDYFAAHRADLRSCAGCRRTGSMSLCACNSRAAHRADLRSCTGCRCAGSVSLCGDGCHIFCRSAVSADIALATARCAGRGCFLPFPIVTLYADRLSVNDFAAVVAFLYYIALFCAGRRLFACRDIRMSACFLCCYPKIIGGFAGTCR